MDPKLGQLDPKLREAYDRVMNGGGAGSAPSAPTPTQMPAQSAPIQPVSQPPITAPLQSPAPAAPNLDSAISNDPPPSPAPSNPPAQSGISPVVAFNAHNTGKNQGTTGTKKDNSKLLPVIIVVGAILFFVIYAVVWMVVFKLKLPFLP